VIERVVEDWLANVNELGYEESFIHALIAEGHTVVHRQKHGSLELGKDIITRDSDGQYHSYQLKGGDIDLPKWERISGQIQITVSSPILHPNVPPTAQFTPYLVTNGVITDPVRADIANRNIVWEQQHQRRLQLIQYGELLDKFLRLQSSFLPTKPRDFQLFLTFYLADKQEPLNCIQFSELLLSMLPPAGATRAELRRLFAAVIIVADYVISGYEGLGNYYAATQGWSVLTFHLMRVCEAHRNVSDWQDSLNLLVESIDRCASRVIQESLESANLMEGMLLVDEKVWPYRLTAIVGLLSAYMISHRLSGHRIPNEHAVFGKIRWGAGSMRLWGEFAAPSFFLAAECLCLRGAERAGIDLAVSAIKSIIERNGKDKQGDLADPYYSDYAMIRHQVLGDSIFEDRVTFGGRSYSIRQFVEFVARRNWPNTLQRLWFNIAPIWYEEFAPEEPSDSYIWLTKRGSTDGRRWKHPQRWRDLIDECCTVPSDATLLIETAFRHVLPYFILFMPHRFTPKRARVLDLRVLEIQDSECR
jgi:hypothetical protein